MAVPGKTHAQTCTQTACEAGPCRSGASLLLAESSEVPPGCPNRITLADPQVELTPFLATHDLHMTPAAARRVSPHVDGGPAPQMADLIRMGALVLLELKTAQPIRGGGSGRRTPTPPPEPVAPQRPDVTSWIKLRVVDDASGEPLAGVALQVRMPNGKQFGFTTRPDGRVEVNDIDPGECEASCPLDDAARLTDTFAYVAMGPAPASPGGTGQTNGTGGGAGGGGAGAGASGGSVPLPVAKPTLIRGVRIAKIEEHRVQTGETLDSLAQANGLTWQALAKFNWNTADPNQINRHLRDDVGCTKRTADGKNYVFDSEDKPGILYIPKPWSQGGLATEQEHILRVKSHQYTPGLVECVCIPGVTFEFDKSFIRPTVVDVMKSLQTAADRNPTTKIMIFGHTDKVGSESYNKLLSERRARSVYAFITNDVPAWEELADDPKEKWGALENNQMLADQGFNPASDPQAVKKYQQARGIPDSGVVDPQTRRQLFTDYMSGKHDLTLGPDRFMDRRHMGCGEFNPQVQTEAANEANRRVTFFLFDPDRLPNLPCPTEAGDLKPCKAQNIPTASRNTKSFTCGFFDGIARTCRCENPDLPPVTTHHTLRGKLFWNRTWDYNDETTPIPAEKEFLPGAKVELRIQKPGGTLSVHQVRSLTDEGEFEFTEVPKAAAAALRILLEYRDGKVVVFKGQSNAVTEADFEVRRGAVIWHQMNLDAGKLDGSGSAIDLGELEITRDHFVDICDAYKTVWYGHKRILEMTETDLPLCPTFYPGSGSFHRGGELFLIKDDLKDRDVVLHEYGHFIRDKMIPGYRNPGYGYNDDAAEQHSPTSLEHYESAWNEACATFLSCAITDDPHYHDGYDTNLNQHLDSDNIQVGGHAEGSVQCALWDLYKVQGTDFKDGFWKAWTDHSQISVFTALAFYENWKALGLPDLAKLVASYRKFNMRYLYRYRTGGERFTAVAAPASFDAARREFRTIAELHTNFGSIGGGAIGDYNEEFYNRNQHFNAGSLGAGSTRAAPVIQTGTAYIVPERVEVQ